MVEFGGWEMPIAYPAGTIEEHLACRRRVVMFDVSHLGRFSVTGEGAAELVRRELCNDITRVATPSITGSVMGKNSTPKSLLNLIAMSRVSSICCFWSSPTGTCVA